MTYRALSSVSWPFGKKPAIGPVITRERVVLLRLGESRRELPLEHRALKGQ